MSTPKFFLVLICLLFLFTRLYKIADIPQSVYWDEASIGYNAYSILKTGRDEWGDFLPIHFRAFGEFKLPVYIYSVVPFVAIFGLNEFSVRIPAVLFSLVSLILTYILAKKLFDNKTGLFAAFFVAISPWFFIFSRTGFEATAGLMFYLLGIYLFLRFKFLAILSFIISAYSYNSFRAVVPLTILILVFFERDSIRQILKKSLHWAALALVFIVLSIWPIYRLYVYDVGFFRLQAVGTVSVETFIKNYFSHFGLDFLLNGDKNLRHQQEGFGQIYIPELILIAFGLLYLVRSKSKYKLLPLILVLVGPIPAALTKEAPHALRAFSMISFISIISAMGVLFIKRYLPQKYLVESAVVIIFLAFFANYFIYFTKIYPVQSSQHWQYDYKKIFTEYKDEFVKYDKVIISDQYAQPYIFALFYLKYNPQDFLKEVERASVDKWGFSTVARFGKFEFGKVDELLKLERIRNDKIGE